MRLRFFRRSVLLLSAARRAMLLLATLTLAAGLLPAGVRADIQNPGRSSFRGDRRLDRQGGSPPNGVAQTVTVPEGGSVTIILRSRGHAGEMVDFLIRNPPEHGTLDAAPRQLTLDTAAVVYMHRPGGDNTSGDSFTYSVQAQGGPVSSEQRVSIHIQEPPPVLAVSPPELDFGAVRAGQSTRAQMTLTNQGGSEAAGRLDPPQPWVVEGRAEFRLPRGASQTFTLVFKPQIEHAYVDSIRFRYETVGGGVRLIGTGLAGPGQPALAGEPAGLATQGLTPAAGLSGAEPLDGSVASLTPGTDAARGARDPGAPVPVPGGPAPADAGAGANTNTNANAGMTIHARAIPEGGSSLPSAAGTALSDLDDTGVPSFNVTGRGRSTLDLSWRALTPAPKSYRVELRNLSLDQDDRLVVDWRPYARTEFHTAHGFVTARLSGLAADSQECIRIVAVDASGQLATPSPLRIAYTLPASTWWRPTTLKVLCLLLLICVSLVVRNRLETHQILRELDAASSRRAAMS